LISAHLVPQELPQRLLRLPFSSFAVVPGWAAAAAAAAAGVAFAAAF
jgi:hypothetical protein